MPTMPATTGSKLLRNTDIPAGPVQLADRGGKVLEPRLHEFLARADRGRLREAMAGADNLVSCRKAYAHGATPADEKCLADLAACEPRFRRLREESRRYALRHLAAHGGARRVSAPSWPCACRRPAQAPRPMVRGDRFKSPDRFVPPGP